jgi:putative endonuclease
MTDERQPCVYILTSQARGTLYIGVTSNLVARLWQHRTAAKDGFTQRYQVMKLVYYERFDSMEPAIAREKQLKRWHRQWKINLIETANPDWHDLAIGLGFSLNQPATRHRGP